MVAFLIALVTAASLMWSPAADAHPMKPVAPSAAAMPAAPTAPTDAAELAAATAPSETQAPPAATDNALLILVVLAVAVGAPCLVRRLRRPTLALATAGLLVTLVADSAPHLVHHAFEPGKGAECQILQVAGHADGALDSPEAPPIVMAAVRLDPAPRLPARAASAPSSRTRAPPA
jgi:hypothetical protein